MSLNFGSICRLCMMQTNAMLPLFSEDDILQNRIMAVVPVIKVCVLCLLVISIAFFAWFVQWATNLD
jgi:hypothetical protein